MGGGYLPRPACGERSDHIADVIRVRGDSPRVPLPVEFAERPPHPNPLPVRTGRGRGGAVGGDQGSRSESNVTDRAAVSLTSPRLRGEVGSDRICDPCEGVSARVVLPVVFAARPLTPTLDTL